MTSIFSRKQRHIRHESLIAADEMQETIDSQEQEVAALRQQLKILRDKYQEAKEKIDLNGDTPEALQRKAENTGDALYQRQRIEKLMGVVAEREKQMRDLQQELQAMTVSHNEALQHERKEKQTAHNEVDALHAQLTALKAKYLEGQRRQQNQDAEIAALTSEKEQSDIKLLEAVRVAEHRDYLESECERMTQVQIDLTLRLEEATARVQSLEDALKAKEELLQAKEMQVSTLAANMEEIERKMVALQSERNLLQDNVFRTQSAQEDAEARLKVAHFHLAKKVKETSQLTDRNEELEAQLREVTTDLSDSQDKIHGLQKLFEEQLDQEKSKQEKLQDSFKEAEALAAAWEEKYFKISEKWQEYELRFNEMKKLEEKLQKVHSQWINMGFHFDGLDHSAPP